MIEPGLSQAFRIALGNLRFRPIAEGVKCRGFPMTSSFHSMENPAIISAPSRPLIYFSHLSCASSSLKPASSLSCPRAPYLAISTGQDNSPYSAVASAGLEKPADRAKAGNSIFLGGLIDEPN